MQCGLHKESGHFSEFIAIYWNKVSVPICSLSLLETKTISLLSVRDNIVPIKGSLPPWKDWKDSRISYMVRKSKDLPYQKILK